MKNKNKLQTMTSFSEEIAHPLAKYKNHLEFNGYSVEEVGDQLFGHHPRKPNLSIKPIEDRGALVSVIYSFQEGLRRYELLEYLNDLNSQFVFMKAFIDEENDLVMETFFEGEYSRINFSILLENIEHDMQILYEHDLTENYVQ
jgi:hypothetical protein